MTTYLSSRYFHLIYGFFALSWLPYIFIRLAEQPWIYSLMYRANGIVENMTVVFYFLAAGFAGRLLYDARPRAKLFWALFLIAVFMLGEETRYGLIYVTDNVKEYSFTGIQDLVHMAFFQTPETLNAIQNALIILARLGGFILVVCLPVYAWVKRHSLPDFTGYKSAPFTPYVLTYVLLLLAALIIEFCLPTGRKLFIVLEETLEMNAAFIWFIVAYTANNLYRPHLRKII